MFNGFANDVDVLLDESAFERAANRLDMLSHDMKELRQRVASLLEELQLGFDTPAGKVFFEACGSNLFQPMDYQILVITYVAENLRQARAEYQSVFTEYEALNNSIRNA